MLVLEGISKSYPGVHALTDVDLVLREGEVLGIAGENGAGKTTLISIINGTVTPDQGTVTVRGETHRVGSPASSAAAGIATVYQEQGLIPSLLVYENIFLGQEQRFTTAGFLSTRDLREAAQSMLDELDIDVSAGALTGSLSFSDRQRVEIAKAFALASLSASKPIILLDEPTSGLSEDETDALLNNMNSWRSRASFILISHRLAHLFRAADRLAVFKDGRNIATIDVNSTDEEHLHELIVGRKRDSEYYRESSQRPPSNEVTIRVSDLTREPFFRGVDLEVRKGEIVGLAGVRGCGKTELARAIIGMEPFSSGRVELQGENLPSGNLTAAMRRGGAYIPAERLVEGIIADQSVEFNLSLPVLRNLTWGRTPLLSPRRRTDLTDSWITRLSIKTAGGSALMRTMSGGNQQKVVFGKWLSSDVKLLVLDDPGRGLDVGAKEDIYELLRELSARGVSIVLVSDNLPEVIGLSHRIYAMRGGEITAVVDSAPDHKPTEAQLVRNMV